MADRMLRSPDSGAPPKASDRTREQLLEAAGEVFAAKGYDGATSRQICFHAGVNAAAVNYHFGGIDGLYAATLAQAHRRFVKLETLAEIASSGIDARAKLRAFLNLTVRRLMQPAASSWEMRLISREIISPSPARDALMETEILPKKRIFKAIVGELIGRDPDDPVVGRAMLTVSAPCMLLALGDRTVLETILPSIGDPAEIEPLVRHFELFILAGLEAVKRECEEMPPA